ncbi:DUF4123 domain-containing protein [Photobacterium sp.]|uniref:DUF4123 domain-containing protein n=1 Tax=Photobacterium sp. TaxID=660 RepID=UPI00299DD0F0|nr:DUF4123 domain-containing protein [Photobacterium sp.]MDX1304661.1 DUF4123 domain-containing protein [Photobacterium sp.]
MSISSEQTYQYLIIDGASVDNLAKSLYDTESDLNGMTLYAGTALQSVMDISPWVVESTGALYTWFQECVIPLNAGMILHTDADLETVTQHWKSLLHAQNTHNETVIFRAYDPRIFSALIQSSTEQQLSRLFGPVRQVSVWEVQSQSWQQFSNTSQSLDYDESEQFVLTGLNAKKITEVTEATFIQRLVEHIQTYFPQQHPSSDEIEMAEVYYHKAHSLGFSSERAVFYFTNVICLLGMDVLVDDTYPDIKQLLTEPSLLTPSQRVHKAALLAAEYKKELEL